MNVAFLIFNRPDVTELAFAAIRAAQPAKLFVIADGPRDSTETSCCEAARAVTERVDWPCTVERRYADCNLGCRVNVSSGLDWVFSRVDSCIILEDDCVADPSFFTFADEALKLYAHNERVGSITGINHGNFQQDTSVSCHLSRHPGIWGWATWRRAWELYRYDPDWLLSRVSALAAQTCRTRRFCKGWYRMLHAAALGEISSWGSFWVATLASHRLLTLRPRVNLVANMGEQSGAHCGDAHMPAVYTKAYSLDFPLAFPSDVNVDPADDISFERQWASIMMEPFSLRRSMRTLRWRVSGAVRSRLQQRHDSSAATDDAPGKCK
jgi:hypothetical protein